jgi:uncharacterized lipoprotein
MRILKIGLFSFAAISLTACSTIGDRYGFLKDAKQTYQNAPMMEQPVVIPQNLRANDSQDYYEVPQNVSSGPYVKPSLAPPGSNLDTKPQPVVVSQQDRIRNAETAKIQGHTSAVANNTPATVSLNFAQAWVKVGHVLQAANYKIVEKDNALGTYYVIDTKQTGGKVKKDMPIYQVQLKASGNSTLVTVSPGNPTLQSQLRSALND